MQLLDNLALGLATALSLSNLSYALLGCLIGTLIGVLPGLGPLVTIAMLIPLTYGLEPVTALIMLSSIYYGAQYGGSTTAILLKLPGESSSAITMLDGHAMAMKGRAGPALAGAALGSLFAGCVGTLLIAAFAVPLSALALSFGASEYFALMVLGLVTAVVLSSDRLDKSLGMVIIGLLLGLIGTDVNSGTIRFAFGTPALFDGIDFACVAMGLFGIGEIIATLESSGYKGNALMAKVEQLWPSRADLRRMLPPALRGTALGSLLGVLPGAGVTIAAFGAYSLEKRFSRNRDELGHGAIEGVVGPESANNAAAQTSFIPLLTLGIPSGAVMALMVGAMIVHNIQPGPQLIVTHPAAFWGLIVSMFIGNLMLVILNLPLVGVWAKLLKVPYRFLFPSILIICTIGIYSLQSSFFDIYLMLAFGLLGYALIKLQISAVPLLLGFVLGPMLEENFRRAMLLSGGEWGYFLDHPITLGILGAALALLAGTLLPALKKRKQTLASQGALDLE